MGDVADDYFDSGMLAALDGDDYEPVWDFSLRENVLVKVVADDIATRPWKKHSIESVVVIDSKDDVAGAATYETFYGGFLDQVIADLCDEPANPGWYVAEEITADFSKDYWGEVDGTYYVKCLRPATAAEIQEWGE